MGFTDFLKEGMTLVPRVMYNLGEGVVDTAKGLGEFVGGGVADIAGETQDLFTQGNTYESTIDDALKGLIPAVVADYKKRYSGNILGQMVEDPFSYLMDAADLVGLGLVAKGVRGSRLASLAAQGEDVTNLRFPAVLSDDTGSMSFESVQRGGQRYGGGGGDEGGGSGGDLWRGYGEEGVFVTGRNARVRARNKTGAAQKQIGAIDNLLRATTDDWRGTLRDEELAAIDELETYGSREEAIRFLQANDIDVDQMVDDWYYDNDVPNDDPRFDDLDANADRYIMDVAREAGWSSSPSRPDFIRHPDTGERVHYSTHPREMFQILADSPEAADFDFYDDLAGRARDEYADPYVATRNQVAEVIDQGYWEDPELNYDPGPFGQYLPSADSYSPEWESWKSSSMQTVLPEGLADPGWPQFRELTPSMNATLTGPASKANYEDFSGVLDYLRWVESQGGTITPELLAALGIGAGVGAGAYAYAQ